VLLDFGACNEYGEAFIEKYREVVIAGTEREREEVIRIS
jgi:hypothetical protein